MPLNSFSEVTPLIGAQVWLTADGTSPKTIVAAQPTGWRIDTLVGINDDSVAHVVTLTLIDPTSTIHGIGSVSLPALAGHSPNPAVDLFNVLFPSTQVGLAFPAGWAIEASMAVTVTLAVGLVAYGGYF